MKAYLSQEEGTVCSCFVRAQSLKLRPTLRPCGPEPARFLQARILSGPPCSAFLTQASERKQEDGWGRQWSCTF